MPLMYTPRSLHILSFPTLRAHLARRCPFYYGWVVFAIAASTSYAARPLMSVAVLSHDGFPCASSWPSQESVSPWELWEPPSPAHWRGVFCRLLSLAVASVGCTCSSGSPGPITTVANTSGPSVASPCLCKSVARPWAPSPRVRVRRDRQLPDGVSLLRRCRSFRQSARLDGNPAQQRGQSYDCRS
jgi:hypothetical protein